MAEIALANNSKRRADRRRAVRAALKSAIERQYGLPPGALKPKPLTHHGYAPLRPTRPGPGSRKSWKKKRRAARAERSRAKKAVRRG